MTLKTTPIRIDGEQTPKDYYVVRIKLVHVKRGLFGFQDKELLTHSFLPDTRLEAVQTVDKLAQEISKLGKTIQA